MNITIEDWLPKSVILLRNYDRHKFVSDLIAGITVGLVALPLAMAFAIASGVPPQAGLYCAIVTGFLISALGGSKTQIGGPTGAFVVVVAGIVAKYGVDGLFTCTMMAGVLLVLLGITGLGTAVKYFPRPVVVGFTNGIAILIASTQIRDFFGLRMDHVPGDFFHRMAALGRAFSTLNWEATLLAAGSLVVMILCLKFARRVPGAILVCFGSTAAVALFHLPVETIGTRFGGIPSGLPHIDIPSLHYDTMRQLLSPALTVAMLGAIESLMSAVVSDKMSNDKHNPNVELMGQGVANIFSPLFGGLPATGAIARCRHDPCAHAAGHHSFRRAPGKGSSPCRFGRHPDDGCLQHGRLGGDPGDFEAHGGGYRGVARHHDPDGRGGPYVCHGSGHGPCGALVHPQGLEDHHG